MSRPAEKSTNPTPHTGPEKPASAGAEGPGASGALSASDWPAWFHSAAHPDTDAALRALYADLDAAVAARGPRCDQSGRCCNFTAYGHRLYVTALEIAWFLGQVPGLKFEIGSSRPAAPAATRLPVLNFKPQPSNFQLPDACPYQIDDLCSVHAVRPLGCRVFFCEPGTEDWQHDTYECFLTRLRQLHDRLNIPYRYLEWRAGLLEAREAVGL